MTVVASAPQTRSRRAWSYLALPRPIDAAVKSTFVPGGYALAILAAPERDRVPATAAVVVWIVFELGFYAGRYTVNDIIDRAADAAHPAASRRGRIPAKVSDVAALVSVLVRGVACLVAPFLLGGRAGTALASAMGAGAFVSVGYEWLRDRSGRRRPGPPNAGAIRALWIWVGGGYGIRLALGVGLAGGPAVTVLVALGAGWIFGVMFVLQTWTLEAAGLFAYGDSATATAKPHVARLVETPVSWHPLRAGAAARRTACWAVVACGAGGLLGLALTRTGATPALIVAAISAITSVGTLLLVKAKRPWVSVTMTAVAVMAVVVSAPGSGPAAAGPPLIVLVTAIVFALSGPELVGFASPPTDRN